MHCSGSDVLTAVRMLLILGGIAAILVLLRYDLEDIEGGAILAAILANTAVITYIVVVDDTETVRIVQDIAILVFYFAVIRNMLRSHRKQNKDVQP